MKEDSKEFYDYSLALGDYLASINARIPNNHLQEAYHIGKTKI